MHLNSIIGIVVVLVLIPLAIVLLNDLIFHRKPPKKERAAAAKRFEERLLNPDFTALEAHFGCPLPPALKELYANKDEIMRGDFEVIITQGGKKKTWTVAFYQPADKEAVTEMWEGLEGKFAARQL